MTAMILQLRPFYEVRPGAAGRWLVVHALPGQPGAFAVDEDCPNQQAAECAAAWRERERQRMAEMQREQRRLLGMH